MSAALVIPGAAIAAMARDPILPTMHWAPAVAGAIGNRVCAASRLQRGFLRHA